MNNVTLKNRNKLLKYEVKTEYIRLVSIGSSIKFDGYEVHQWKWSRDNSCTPQNWHTDTQMEKELHTLICPYKFIVARPN